MFNGLAKKQFVFQRHLWGSVARFLLSHTKMAFIQRELI